MNSTDHHAGTTVDRHRRKIVPDQNGAEGHIITKSKEHLRQKVVSKMFHVSNPGVLTALAATRLQRSVNMQNYTARVDLMLNSSYMEISTSCDGEGIDVIEQFFWGYDQGIVVELGALDGIEFSQSLILERLGWRRLLIEAHPKLAQKIPVLSPQAVGVNAVICKNETIVHYLDAKLTGGILEFMSPVFLSTFHNDVAKSTVQSGNVSSIDWKLLKKSSRFVNGALTITPVPCVRLGRIFRQAGISHGGLLILDVEGVELMVLQSLDWTRFRFDVVCVEIEVAFRPKGYYAEVMQWMESVGYASYKLAGRNVWFIHKDFVPSTRPGVSRSCFRGQKFHKREKYFRNCTGNDVLRNE